MEKKSNVLVVPWSLCLNAATDVESFIFSDSSFQLRVTDGRNEL